VTVTVAETFHVDFNMDVYGLRREKIPVVMDNWVRWSLIPFVFWCVSCTHGVKKEVSRPLAQWQKLGPGGGGATFIPTFSYHASEEFLLRCDMTGSYLTHDGGSSYQQINFPNGAGSFAFDPYNRHVIYIGAAGLNRSIDGGKTWDCIFPNAKEVTGGKFHGDHGSFAYTVTAGAIYNTESPSVSHIRVDPVQRDAIYFSMGKAFYYSTDQGSSFVRMDLRHPVDLIYTNATSLKDQVLIITSHSVVSFDKRSHALKEQPLPSSLAPAFSFTAGTRAGSDSVLIYALRYDPTQVVRDEFGYTELWRSHDQGTTWSKVTDALVNNDQAAIKPSYSMISCAEFDAGHAYLVCNRYEEMKDGKIISWYGALKTGDSGRRWRWVWKGGGGSGQYGVKDGIGAANLQDAWAEKAFGGEYIRLMDIGVSPHDGQTAVVTDWYRSMKTTDGGETWREVYSLAQPGGSFTSRGLDVTTAYGVHSDPFDTAHIAISYTDIGYHHSFDGGRSWVRAVEGIPAAWQNTCYWVAFDPAAKNKLWSAWSSLHDFPRGKMTRDPKWKNRAHGGIAVSTDGGQTWEPRTDGMGDNSAATCVVIDPTSPADRRTLYASVYNKGVFKSVDDGKTWTLKYSGITENTCAFELTLTTQGTLFLVVSPTPVHAGGQRGSAFYPGAVYRSTDGAETWTKLTIGQQPVIFPSGLDFDRENPNRVYLACWSDITLSDLVGGAVTKVSGNRDLPSEGGIFQSDDNGNTWQQILSRHYYVYDVTVDPRHPGRLYANTFNQLALRSNDSGKTWHALQGYDFHWGHRVQPDPHHADEVYLTTYGSSVWHGVPAAGQPVP